MIIVKVNNSALVFELLVDENLTSSCNIKFSVPEHQKFSNS